MKPLAMSSENLLVAHKLILSYIFEWNVDQRNIGCRSFRWPQDIWIECGYALNGDVADDAILKWNGYEPYCYEALKEVPKVVCMKTSLAIGLLWSVCDMVCNDETSGSLLYLFVSLNVVFETRMQLILFAHVSVSRTDRCVLQGNDQSKLFEHKNAPCISGK